MVAFLHRFAAAIQSFSEWSGRLISWLVLALVLVISYDVAMRYLLQEGSVALQELEWHLFALIFLLAAAYTLKHDAHVRVDVFYRSRFMTDRRRAWVDLLGGLLFLVPFCLLLISGSIPFVSSSFGMLEGSPDPGGLPFRFVLKAAIPLGFLLLLLQGIAIMMRCACVLLRPEEKTAARSVAGED
jgi:TRAP-type mannitol/chloroaromatic compound transport system permease small subunit